MQANQFRTGLVGGVRGFVEKIGEDEPGAVVRGAGNDHFHERTIRSVERHGVSLAETGDEFTR